MAYVLLANGDRCPVVIHDGRECIFLSMELSCVGCILADPPGCEECDGTGRVLNEWHEPTTWLDVHAGEAALSAGAGC